MPVATLTLLRPHGRRLRVLVVTPDRRRRRSVVRGMRAAGWSVSRIGAALRLSPQRITALIAGPRLFDDAMRAAIQAEHRRLAIDDVAELPAEAAE